MGILLAEPGLFDTALSGYRRQARAVRLPTMADVALFPRSGLLDVVFERLAPGLCACCELRKARSWQEKAADIPISSQPNSN